MSPVVLSSGNKERRIFATCSWSPDDPGMSAATQVYGTVLASAVMVIVLFLVQSLLFQTLDWTGCNLVPSCRK